MPIERVRFLNVSDVMRPPNDKLMAACELHYAMAKYALEGWQKAEALGYELGLSNPPPHTMDDLAREVQANNS